MQAKSSAIMLSKGPVLTPVWGLSLIALKVPPAVHTSYSSKARQPWKLGLGAAGNCFTLFNASTLSIASARSQNQHFLWTCCHFIASDRLSCCVGIDSTSLRSLWQVCSDLSGEESRCQQLRISRRIIWIDKKKKKSICQNKWQLMRFSYTSIFDCVFTWLPFRPFP